MKSKILVTGFEPFGGEATNPSMEIAKALDGEGGDNYCIRSAILPVERFQAIKAAVQLINEVRPDIVIALGVAVGRKDITPEKVAINFDDYRIADNGGNQPVGEPIVASGETAYFSTLPINAMCQAMAEAGAPSSISFSAGTFVCNHVMYGILEHIEREKLPIRAGFIHVPQASEFCSNQDTPSQSLATMVEALKRSIMVAVNSEHDIKQVGGNTH